MPMFDDLTKAHQWVDSTRLYGAFSILVRMECPCHRGMSVTFDSDGHSTTKFLEVN